MRDFLKEIGTRILVHDGSKGYMLQKLGLKGGECGELWNITKPELVAEIYRSYLDAGADVIQTNTFTANRIQLRKFSLEEKTYEINYMGAKLAREVAGESNYVSASIGPAGLLMEPSGKLGFEEAYEVYCEQVKAVADGGVDIVNFETFTDLAEMRAALLAAKDSCSLPVICSLAFENNGKTLMGTGPFVAVVVLKALGADLVGANCSFGPENMAGIAEKMKKAGGGYLSIKPNAGMPKLVGGGAIYEETPEHFAQTARKFAECGARLIGGCCGTTPEYIKVLRKEVDKLEPAEVGKRVPGIITSNVRHIAVSELDWNSIGRADSSKDSELLAALGSSDLSYVEDMALDLASEGYDAVYVNVDEARGSDGLLAKVVNRLQGYVKDPLIMETSSPAALDKALRLYRGIAGVVIGESSSGSRDDLKKVVGKYGGEIIAEAVKGS